MMIAGGMLVFVGVAGRAPGQSPEPVAVPAAVAPRTAREAVLEDRLRRMEGLLERMPDPEHVRELEATVRRLSSQVDQLSTRLREAESPGRTGPSVDDGVIGPDGSAMGPGDGGAVPGSGSAGPVGGDAVSEDVAEEIGFGGTAAGFGPSAEIPTPRFDMPGVLPDRRTRSHWGPGFQLRTDDDEFDIQFHNLTQIDGRFYGIPDQDPVADTFDIARQWFIFNGHLTRPYEYYVSFVQAFDSFSALDIFLNVNYDKRFQFRFGRYKSPFAYEFYAQPTEALASGEWSVFFNNFGMNRDVGAMLWGESLFKRVDYAAGIFNGTPNAQVDLSNPKSLIAYLNLAPFRPREGSPLENFNVGGSVVAGSQDHAPVPSILRTIVPTAGSNVIGVPFLIFNGDVKAEGPRDLWSLHTAYFYRSLMLLAEWQSGFQTYGLTDKPGRARVPVEGFYVQGSYFLTGETMASRGRVIPRRNFDLRRGRRGPGAWEPVFRYAYLDIGEQVFGAGLADPDIWTNRLYLTDVGINWYWNPYIRVLFDWQHAGFSTPVQYRPGGLSSTSDLFMLRFQFWF
ncbi:MAG: hypothetical protein BGO49_05960 [Planctomycetales bacterium 71-10]|nr:MAG: hypothetical protein BGO49_05960 [Planctomycetales bacterium 71-10]